MRGVGAGRVVDRVKWVTAPTTEIFVVLFLWGKLRISLGLVDLSRIQSEAFFLFSFREVHRVQMVRPMASN